MIVELDAAALDRAVGALLGLAAGDALGAGYEFGPAFTTTPVMKGGGLGWAPGEWTDDTQMALCIAEVTARGSVDVHAIGDRFLAWMRGGPTDVGIQTRSVLSSVMTGSELAAAAGAHFARHPKGAAGNGSLMRTALVALACLGDDDAVAAAMAVSALTHGDPLAGEACAIWCIGIDRAVREQRLDGVRDGIELLPADRRDQWTAWLDEAETASPDSFTPNGFVVTALQAAWAAITQTPVPGDVPCLHLQRALERAVQIGHDTDTVAAIAGQLLGARWGASAIPMHWREVMHGWPGYRVRDLVRLAVLSARRGESDPHGWPACDDMLGHYERSGARGDPPVALEDDPGVRLGDSRSVVHAAPGDVVLSLCRMGLGDVPAGVERHDVWLQDRTAPELNPNLDFMLLDTAEAIFRWRAQGGNVVIHCAMAQSRTPTIAAAYLCARFEMSSTDALERVGRSLRRSRPNPTFQAALQRLWP